jgi:hypothetical protein
VASKTKKFWKTFSSTSNISTQPNLLHTWRQTALDWVLRGVFIFASPVLILGLINLRQDYLQGNSLIQTAGLGALYLVVFLYTAAITFLTRFELRFRVGSFIFILFSVGLANLVTGGLSSDGLLIIFAAIAFASVFYDFRGTIIILALGMAIGVIVAWLLVSGTLVIMPELQANSANLASWVVRGLVLALLSTALVLATTYLVRSLERSLFSLQKQTENLVFLNEIALDISTHKKMNELLQTIAMHAAK